MVISLILLVLLYLPPKDPKMSYFKYAELFIGMTTHRLGLENLNLVSEELDWEVGW